MLNTIQDKILKSYVSKLPPMIHKQQLTACASFQSDNLVDAVKQFKRYYDKRMRCKCGCYTAWTIGRCAGNRITYYCFNHQPILDYSISKVII